MEDIVAVVLRLCCGCVACCVSRHAPASHVISEWALSRYKISVRGSAFSTSPTLPNVSVITIKSCTCYWHNPIWWDPSLSMKDFIEGASNCLCLLFSRTTSPSLWASMSAQTVRFFAAALAKAWDWPMVPLEAPDKKKHIWEFGKTEFQQRRRCNLQARDWKWWNAPHSCEWWYKWQVVFHYLYICIAFC